MGHHPEQTMNEPIAHTPDNAGPGAACFEPMPKTQTIRFDQVGGLDELKRQARIKIIEPFRNPALFKRFNKTAGGGLLLYGPPGCGKTWFARAIAGECEASFFNVGIGEILDMYVGNSEKNIHALFETARQHKPAVIFIDEIDALGRKRELLRHSNITSTINAFLAEMDGVASDNAELLVLGATNAPWDVDNAFRRPGRFDRTLLVPPPDASARQAILQQMLHALPVGALDYAALAERSAGFSGADLKGLVDRVSEQVLENIIASGADLHIEQAQLLAEIAAMRPSTTEWLDMARNVIEFANQGGLYDELASFLEQHPVGKKRLMGFLR
jgi:SpoVK/Ycf46/Vps4 family AAA+-type ATPase